MMFKRRENIPQIKRSGRSDFYPDTPRSMPKIGGPARRGGLGIDLNLRRRLGRRPHIPQLYSHQRQKRRGFTLAWIALSAAIGMLLLLLTVNSWLPRIASIIPDRYIMAYAPEGLKQIIFEIDVSEQVPTPIASMDGDVEALVAEIPTPTLAVTPTPAPTLAPGALPSGGYIQPTLVAVAPTPTVTPAFSVQVDPRAVDRENAADLSQIRQLLTGFNWEQQGYNNCGPASLKVYMSYWGVEFTEQEAAAFLKPNPEDPNVRPDEMAAFAATKGYQTQIRINGTIDKLKQIILAGYPVMIETGYDPEPDTIGWTSHYLTLVGFTDDGFIAMDTYRRPNWYYNFEEVDQYWRQFNRKYIIFHRPDQAVAVASLISGEMNDQVMYENARYTTQLELSVNRNDPFGWANLGSILVELGDYESAVSAFNQARRLGLPWRYFWYQFEGYEAYLQTGRYDEVIAIADSVLEKKGSEEAYYYRGVALIAQGNVDQGKRQLELALRFNKNYEAAQLALDALGS